ncbi:MAG: hypothetical protein ACRD5G_11255 [Candidatus Acidiferrales bacterium]
MVRCPKCSASIDLDEDEVEEGEIMSCEECEAELEVVSTAPVQLNVLPGEDDEDEEDLDEEEDDAEDEDDEEDELEEIDEDDAEERDK